MSNRDADMLGVTIDDEKKTQAALVQEAYENGASDVEICEILKITLGKFNTLYESNSQFRDAVDLGRIMSEAWWTKIARSNLKDRSFNTSLWAFNMKNRFGWAEKSESVNQTGADLSVDQLREKLNDKLTSFLKNATPGIKDKDLLHLRTEGGEQ